MQESSNKTRDLVVTVGFLSILGIFAFYSFSFFFGKDDTKTTEIKNTTSLLKKDDFSEDMLIDYDAFSEKFLGDQSTLTVIDIRPSNFYNAEHIPRSVNVPLELFDRVPPPDNQTVIIIAKSGDERGIGAQAVALLRDKSSRSAVFVLDGGFEMWKASGGKTISFGNPDLITDHAKINIITADELKKLSESNQSFLVLDMRPYDLYKQSHIPKALNLPFDQLELYYDNIPSGVPIIVHGNSELEDFQAGVRLFDLKFFSVKVLKGGFHDWQVKGFPTEKTE